jgi:hypothetical protein
MSDARAFTARLADLLARERLAQADFLVALAEFDERRLWADLGHRNLFSFLHRELGLSTGAAYLRKLGAEMVRAHPLVLEALRDGRLCISALPEVAKVLTAENCAEFLPRFFHVSRREAQAVAAELRPSEAVPIRTLVTALTVLTVPPTVATPPGTTGPAATRATSPGARGPEPEEARPFHPDEKRTESVEPAGIAASARTAHRPAPPRSEARPLTADLLRLHVTVSRAFLEKLERARAGLAHLKPGASVEDALEAALDALLAAQAKRRGATSRPQRRPRPSNDPRHIPAAVKRAVWARDGGCCRWPLQGGGFCGSTRGLQFDHIRPRALGGLPTVENTRLLCGFHNRLAARLAFGDQLMRKYVRVPMAREPVAEYLAVRPRRRRLSASPRGPPSRSGGPTPSPRRARPPCVPGGHHPCPARRAGPPGRGGP